MRIVDKAVLNRVVEEVNKKVEAYRQIDKAISTVAPENNYNSYDDIYEVTKSQLISWGQALRTARNLLNSKEP